MLGGCHWQPTVAPVRSGCWTPEKRPLPTLPSKFQLMRMIGVFLVVTPFDPAPPGGMLIIEKAHIPNPWVSKYGQGSFA